MSKDGPFHQRIIGRLRALIRRRNLHPGAKFLTEREIAACFKTSRPTANKALSSLASEGLLEVRRGAVTFVREAVPDTDLEWLVQGLMVDAALGVMPASCALADPAKDKARQLGLARLISGGYMVAAGISPALGSYSDHHEL